MAIYVSRKKKVEDSVDTDVLPLLSRAIKVCVIIDINYHNIMQDLEPFLWTCFFNGLLCSLFSFSLSLDWCGIYSSRPPIQEELLLCTSLIGATCLVPANQSLNQLLQISSQWQ